MDTFLFRAVAVEYEAASGATLTLATDLPAPFATRETVSLAATTGSRRAISRGFELTGTTKGRLIDVTVTAPAGGTVIVQRIRLRVRKIGREATDWMWYELPLPRSASDEWITVKVPIPPSPDEMSVIKVPIPPSPDEMSTIKVPIPPSPDEMSTIKVPVPPSPEEMATVRVPVPQSPEEQSVVRVPVPPSPEDMLTIPVAVPPSPEDQRIHEMAMDE
jgi:hypothetical protein